MKENKCETYIFMYITLVLCIQHHRYNRSQKYVDTLLVWGMFGEFVATVRTLRKVLYCFNIVMCCEVHTEVVFTVWCGRTGLPFPDSGYHPQHLFLRAGILTQTQSSSSSIRDNITKSNIIMTIWFNAHS